MSLQEIDFLLIGGGLASAHAAETLRQEGATGSVQILSAEPTLPYHRPKVYQLRDGGSLFLRVQPNMRLPKASANTIPPPCSRGWSSALKYVTTLR